MSIDDGLDSDEEIAEIIYSIRLHQVLEAVSQSN
jgi:hypothetical protein